MIWHLLVELQHHHDYIDRNLLKYFIIGLIAVYIEDPINVSQLVRHSINSFLWEIQDMLLNKLFYFTRCSWG